jgi:hypothetical protein
MLQLITEQPSWTVFLCILLGAAYAFVLYFRERALPTDAPWLKRILAVLRGVTVAFLSFLLLTPLIKTIHREVEKPLVILAQDNSESIAAAGDSQRVRGQYLSDWKALAGRLEKKYDVKTITWGAGVRDASAYAFDEKQTDFSGMLEEADIRYGNRNVGALVIATDGLYNSGSNPLYRAARLQVPGYFVALGDTTVRRDVRIGAVRHNNIVYLGNNFPVEVTVEARQAPGAKLTLTLAEDTVVRLSRELTVSGTRFSRPVSLQLDATQKGLHHYRISVSEVPGEVTVTNNSKDIFVEVRESKERVLILSDAPHPDIGAMKLAIESSPNYEVTSSMTDRFDGAIAGYNLVVLYQVPSARSPLAGLLPRIRQARLPVLFVLGARSSLPALNASGAGITVSSTLNKVNSVTPSLNNDFSLFTLSDETRSRLPAFPPLLAPFGEYRIQGGGNMLFSQQVGNVQTAAPLLAFTGQEDNRTGLLAGEGYWRWRLADYAAHGDFTASQEILQKTVQFLSSKEKGSVLRLNHKTTFSENEPVVFDAEVHNESGELVNTYDVTLTISSRDGKSYPFTFSRAGNAYTLNAGFFPPGDYAYRAAVQLGNTSYSREGKFVVAALQVELTETVADHALLRALATRSGGQVFLPGQLDALADTLLKRDMKPVSYSSYQLSDLINLPWVFFLLLGLLGIEWLARKRSGGY